jgi:predicted glycoside hydrolase/deacetylase ChbG (UPF0249 family)
MSRSIAGTSDDREIDRVVINADDFGISEHVSRDIARCFEAGVISSTTIMANMPFFVGAVALAKDQGFANRVGIHLNLTAGPPLTRGPTLVGPDAPGLSVPDRPLWAPRALVRDIHLELRAQVQRVVQAGIQPTHLDSHEHILRHLPYARSAIAVAREFGIPSLRLLRNAYYERNLAKSSYKTLYNGMISLSGMSAVDWFTDVKPYYLAWKSDQRRLGGRVELMTHPGMHHTAPVDGYTAETDLLLSEGFRAMLADVRLEPYPRQ